MASFNSSSNEKFVWLNGKFVPFCDANVHLLTHGLHYGSCVFEGVRMYNGVIFKNREHNIRFKKSAELLGFEIPYSLDELDLICYEVCKKNNLKNAYIRPTAWLGGETLKIYIPELSVNVGIAAWEMGNYFSSDAKMGGIKICFAKFKRPSPETAPTASKAAGLYMICTSSKRYAYERGYDDALMLDYRGYIAELTGANIFMVIGNELHTPKPDCFLNGITRLTVIDIAKDLGIKVVERHILPEELSGVNDVFVTGTAAEITRISSITTDNGLVYNYNVSDMVKAISDKFSSLTGA